MKRTGWCTEKKKIKADDRITIIPGKQVAAFGIAIWPHVL